MTTEEVIIVGAGPAGLATSACLNVLNIPNIVIEKEDSYAHLWKKKTYDRLKLHLAKEFCSLPHMPPAASAPTYIPKDDFVRYLDEYVVKFNINAVYNTSVESSAYDGGSKTWKIRTLDMATGEVRENVSRFLVVATGENAQGFMPGIPGLKSFDGNIIHSSQYKYGKEYEGKSVLVVGCGNSGMEIAYDLSNFGATTSIAVRNPFHVMTKECIRLGMNLSRHVPFKLVDALLRLLSWLHYGNLSKYGIVRPRMGPLALKAATGRSAVIDVGTVRKIKTGEIQVVKEPIMVNGSMVAFKDGKTHHFDAIVFATGYRSTAKNWLSDEDGWLLNGEGFPKERFPKHWKGKNGLYCVGLARMGLFGIASDAENTANDIAEAVETDQ